MGTLGGGGAASFHCTSLVSDDYTVYLEKWGGGEGGLSGGHLGFHLGGGEIAIYIFHGG